MAAQVLKPVECSAQPLSLAFHPERENLVAVGLVDGTVECKKCGLEGFRNSRANPLSVSLGARFFVRLGSLHLCPVSLSSP